MKFGHIALLVIAGILIIVASMSIFTVRETQHAIKFRFGEILAAEYEPGLHFKWPVINSVKKFDARILTLDAAPETFTTEEQKYIEVDFFAKWKIEDPAEFYRAVHNEQIAAQRLLEVLKDELKTAVSSRSLPEVISAERAEIMGVVTQKANTIANKFGVEVVDVRIKQIELPQSVTKDVYNRMRSEREEVATRIRAEGAGAAEKLRAEAERKKTVILAEAFRESEEIRGAGDAKAADIYAQAYQQNPGFFAFIRSLQAYERSLDGSKDVLVLEPDSEFFRYFESSTGDTQN